MKTNQIITYNQCSSILITEKLVKQCPELNLKGKYFNCINSTTCNNFKWDVPQFILHFDNSDDTWLFTCKMVYFIMAHYHAMYFHNWSILHNMQKFNYALNIILASLDYFSTGFDLWMCNIKSLGVCTRPTLFNPNI